MNWVDFVVLALLLAGIVVGAKKGLAREVSALVLFLCTIIFSVNYLDGFTVWVSNRLNTSAMVSAFLSFIVLLGLSYAAFKLCGLLFYRVASIKSQGKPDQVGGAIVGFVRSWVGVSLLTLVAFMLPMPEGFYSAFDASFLGRAVARTVPMMYESTRMVHPANPSFMTKMEATLLVSPDKGKSGRGGKVDNQREDVYRVMYQLDRFFGGASGT